MLSSGNEPSKAMNHASSSAAASTGGDLGAPVQSLATETSSSFERTASYDTDETLAHQSKDGEEVNRYIGGPAAKAHTYSPANSTPEGNDVTHLSEMRQRVAEHAKKLATLREEGKARVAEVELEFCRVSGALSQVISARGFLHASIVSALATNSVETEVVRENLEAYLGRLADMDAIIERGSRTTQTLEMALALHLESNVYREVNAIVQIACAIADPSERDAFLEAMREEAYAQLAAQQERVREAEASRDAARERRRRTLISLSAEALPALLDQDGVQGPFSHAYITFLRMEILDAFGEEGSAPLDA